MSTSRETSTLDGILGLMIVTGFMLLIAVLPVGVALCLQCHYKSHIDWDWAIRLGVVMAGATAIVGGVLLGLGEFVYRRQRTRSDPQTQDKPPVVSSIPPATLDQLRAQRSRRKPAPGAPGDRPILATVDLFKRAGELDPDDAARAFCKDMDRQQAEVEDRYDAFLLDPGMGPMTYITSDGRILRDSRTWDGEGIQFETSLDGVISALVVGAKKTGFVSLLDLIPPLENGTRCSTCHGTRWFHSQIGEVVCPTCRGRGECPPD
jgi:hypothetical protein